MDRKDSGAKVRTTCVGRRVDKFARISIKSRKQQEDVRLHVQLSIRRRRKSRPTALATLTKTKKSGLGVVGWWWL